MIPSKEVKEKIDARYKKSPCASIDKFLKENPDVDLFLTKLVESDKWFENKRRAFSLIAKNIYEPIKCKVCGKQIKASKCLDSIRQYCSNKCSGSSKDRLEKVKDTSLRRYGVENAFQNRDIQEKQKKTCLRKYGVENVFQDDNVKEKIKQTCLGKYGSEYFSQTDLYLEKIKSTNIQRYGTQFAIQNKDIQKKIRGTNLKKYGVQYPAQCKEIVDKMKQTCLDRYGVDCTLKAPEIDEKRQKTWNEKYGCHPLKSEIIIEKRNKTCQKKYGNKIFQKSIFYLANEYDKIIKRFEGKVMPLFSKEDYNGIHCGDIYKWKCCKCGNQFESKIYITAFDKDEPLLPRCMVCYPHLTGESKNQIEVYEFIKSIYNGKIIRNDRTIIKPFNEEERSKEIDIYLPDLKLAIEYNGLYWHGEKIKKNKNYHLNKTKFCEDNGIQLIQIFEDEWIDKKEIVKDRIKSVLGIDLVKIYARNCKIDKVDSIISNDFLDKNHLQGRDNSSIRYGLYYDDELVALMTFGKPRFNKNYDYQMIRFCSKLGCQVIGGASKLLKHFMKNYEGSIISYADRRYSNGKVYKLLGFILNGETSPNYCYFKNNFKLSRYQCQKHKLKNLLGENNFDENLTQDDNMMLNGFDKVYDCGNLIFVLNRSNKI